MRHHPYYSQSELLPEPTRRFRLKPPAPILLYARQNPVSQEVLHRWANALGVAGYQVFRTIASQPGDLTLPSAPIQMIISFGGDGTLLDTVCLAVRQRIPVLSVNTGRLGFLSLFSPTQTQEVIHLLQRGELRLTHRLVLQIRSLGHYDRSRICRFVCPWALNDIVFFRGNTPNMLTIHVQLLNQETIGVYRGDGLIVATPTGSTAYSLSCGGPILPPNTHAYLLTPIASHNLTLRPLILPGNARIRITVQTERTWQLTVDARAYPRSGKETYEVCLSDSRFPLLLPPSFSYFRLLRTRLFWALDSRDTTPAQTEQDNYTNQPVRSAVKKTYGS